MSLIMCSPPCPLPPNSLSRASTMPRSTWVEPERRRPPWRRKRWFWVCRSETLRWRYPWIRRFSRTAPAARDPRLQTYTKEGKTGFFSVLFSSVKKLVSVSCFWLFCHDGSRYVCCRRSVKTLASPSEVEKSGGKVRCGGVLQEWRSTGSVFLSDSFVILE